MADETLFKPGLEGVIAFESEIAEPDKEGSALRYRGVDIEEIVGRYARTHGPFTPEEPAGRFGVSPGVLGENVTTDGLDALSLPTGTLLRIGADALVALTGIRNPCRQIEARFPGMLKRMVHRDETGELHRVTGAMSVVLQPGVVRVAALGFCAVANSIKLSSPSPFGSAVSASLASGRP